jgi:glycosyltransferase involved in cell wall biosynthesis
MEVLAVGNDAVSVPDDVTVRLCPESRGGRLWRYSPSFTSVLKDFSREDLIFHIHGIWLAPQWMAAKYGVNYKVPVFLSPHNMLGNWFRRHLFVRQIKKTLYWNFVAGPLFRNITAIHALTPYERDALKRYFPSQRIEVIPNAIDLKEVDKNLYSIPEQQIQQKYILFLGRLHPVKGLELLLDAYSKIASNQRPHLIVAGPPCSVRYLLKLKRKVKSHALDNDVDFIGPVWGPKKWALLHGAWVVCIPSYSEGMSMVTLEAMACSVPVITTFSAGITDIPEGGGLLVNPDAEELRDSLAQSLAWSDAERKSRGRVARVLVERRYSWDVVRPHYMNLYRSLVN